MTTKKKTGSKRDTGPRPEDAPFGVKIVIDKNGKASFVALKNQEEAMALTALLEHAAPPACKLAMDGSAIKADVCAAPEGGSK